MLKGITFISASESRKARRSPAKVKMPSFFREHRMYKGVRYENSRLWLLFFVGVMAGTFFANLFFGDGYAQTGIYSEYFMDKFRLMEVKNKELFLYAFENRMKEVLFVCLLSLTSFGALVPVGFLIYKGFSIGILVSIYVLQYGAGGMLLYTLSIFPHYIAYVPMMILLVHISKEMHDDLKAWKEQKKHLHKGKGYAYGKAVLILISLNVVASYLETFLNLPIMTKILK